jgi:hypothetical protein
MQAGGVTAVGKEGEGAATGGEGATGAGWDAGSRRSGEGRGGGGAAGGEEGDGRGDPGVRGGMQEPRQRGRGFDVTRWRGVLWVERSPGEH